MNILVLNGSPKGPYSITLQTVHFLAQRFPQHEFRLLHVGQNIKALERDFAPAAEALAAADLLLFSYPVYTFLAPSQLHRFIELTKAAGVDLRGKPATQLTTSKHFYDVTAHRYIEDNCHDLGMNVIRGLSADMDDLLTPQGRRQAGAFMDYVLWCVARGDFEPAPTQRQPAPRAAATVPEVQAGEKTGDVVLVTDCGPEDENLAQMIDRFRAMLPRSTRVVSLREFPFRGGCLGCFRCAVSGKCVYTDGFDDFLRNSIQQAQAVVYAFTVRDHSMGARFKMYDDRQFCNGHRTVTMGRPVGYLVSGDYGAEPNLQTVLEARAQVGGNFLAGVATDERDPDRAVDALAETLNYALTNRYAPPQNFYGVGGMKIFRDLIYLMQGMMRADHRFYKAHGQYDFPQKKKGTVLKMYLVGGLLASPKVQSKLGTRLNEGMLGPYRKVLGQKK